LCSLALRFVCPWGIRSASTGTGNFRCDRQFQSAKYSEASLLRWALHRQGLTCEFNSISQVVLWLRATVILDSCFISPHTLNQKTMSESLIKLICRVGFPPTLRYTMRLGVRSRPPRRRELSVDSHPTTNFYISPSKKHSISFQPDLYLFHLVKVICSSELSNYQLAPLTSFSLHLFSGTLMYKNLSIVLQKVK